MPTGFYTRTQFHKDAISNAKKGTTVDWKKIKAPKHGQRNKAI